MHSLDWQILKWYPYRTLGSGWGGHVLMSWPWNAPTRAERWVSDLQQELRLRTGKIDNHSAFLIQAPGGRFVLYFHDGGLYQLSESWVIDRGIEGEELPEGV